MTETPRERLAKLMEGLELPKGFRLTPARENMLRGLGKQLLTDNKVSVYYGNKITYTRLSHRHHLNWGRSEMAALRAAAKAGWMTLKVPPQAPATYGAYVYADKRIVFQPGLEQLARRLAAREALWEARRAQHTAKLQTAHSAAISEVSRLRTKLYNISHNPIDVGEHDVLRVFKELQEGVKLNDRVREDLEKARMEVAAIAEPTEEDALVWLMTRQLKGEGA